MRVLLVANTLPPRDLSGVGEQVMQLASGLRDRGHEVLVLGRAKRGLAASKTLFPLTVIVPFARALREFRPHVVQVHESDAALAALLLRVIRGIDGPAPLLVSLLQVSYLEEWRAVRPLRWEGRVLGRPGAVELGFRWLKAPLQIVLGCLTAWLADLVLAPSEVTAAEIRRDYGVGEVGIVPNVTGALPRSAPAAAPRGVPGADLLFVGRLRIRKGVEVLLEALRLLAADGEAARVVIVGDGERRSVLERDAARRGLSDTVHFAGRRSSEEVRHLLRRAQALVVPSIYEGMPLVILEAMDSGLAVIASAVSGIPEVVMDGETGWLVAAENPRELAAALSEVIREPAEAQRRGAAGEERVRREYRPERAAEIWERYVGSRIPPRLLGAKSR